MLQDQYPQTLTRRATRVRPGLAEYWQRLVGRLYVFLPGLGAALLLLCLEALGWLLNPAQLFGRVSGHTLATLFALVLTSPFIWLALLLQSGLVLWLSQWVTRPLVLLAYGRALLAEQEQYRRLYTPLTSWTDPYAVPLSLFQDHPDPTRPRQASALTIPELVETLQHGTTSHLLLLGEEGAGKTLFAHAYLAAVSQQRRALAFGRHLRVPVLVPLKHYALLLQALDLSDPADFSLLDFLDACHLPGLALLRPYLSRLFQQGRLLLLCDGLDEVPAAYRPTLDQELILLFRQNRNALLLTSTPKVYEQSPELIQAVGENLVPRAVFSPMDHIHTRGIVERYLKELDAVTYSQLPTAGQVMAELGRTRLRFFCTTPFYLCALLGALAYQRDAVARYFETRGRLLNAFLKTFARRAPIDAAQMLDFLGELACVMRWNGDDTALYLPDTRGATRNMVSAARGAEQSTLFLAWAAEQRVTFPFATRMGPLLTPSTGPTRQGNMLALAEAAALVDLSAEDVVSFRHPLVASALLADYFARFLGTSKLDSEIIEIFPDDLAPWSEPLTLWAGMLDQPLDAAQSLALYAREHSEQRISALVLSLICLGVAQSPDANEPVLPLPSALATVLEELLDDARVLLELAVLFMRCAERGSAELYQALFPLLALPRIEAFLNLLDPALVAALFFQRLLEIIDDVEQEALVKRLVRALSCWGEAVVPRAASFCSPDAGGRLRTAAINVLGGTHARSAVGPLLACLGDSEQFIVTRAAHALARLGPDLTLSPLLEVLEMPAQPGVQDAILPVIERFLNEPDPARQLTPTENERAIDALMSLLAAHTGTVDLEQVRAILVAQGQLAGERESGKIALHMLVQNLTAANEKVARSMSGTLKEVGQIATPHLLEQLAGQPAEAERVRILEVLASLRDPRALPALLNLVGDNSLAVQQTLVTVFKHYTPICIPGLIDVLLHHADDLVAARAEQVLGELGPEVVEPVIQALDLRVAGRTSLLVHVLERARDPRGVPALIGLLGSTQTDVVLMLAVMQALGQLADERAAVPLLELLAESNTLLAEGALNALSNLGTLVCPLLLTRLASPQKTPLVTRIERVLLGMQPFPGVQLLQAVDAGNVNQARYLAEVFLNRGVDAARALVDALFHERARIREYARSVMERMDGRYAVPALLNALEKPDPALHSLLAGYLLKHPHEAVPALVALLDDPARNEAAVALLLQAGAPVLPELVPALESSKNAVQARARHILVGLVAQQPMLLTNVVQLFSLGLPPRARELVQDVLTDDLEESSSLALLAGLEDPRQVRDVSETLVRLARRGSAHSAPVFEQILQALRVKSRRAGAMLTLIDLGVLAVPGVGALITDPDPEVAQAARSVLSKIGAPSLPFLWAAQSDTSSPERRDAARLVFRAMPSTAVKDELVELLTSARQEEIAMALTLLLERLHDEALQPGHAGEMLPSLLEHVQTSSDERASLRILALLILLGGPLVAESVIDALYADTQGHAHLISTLLLLGQGIEAQLQSVLRDTRAPAPLQAEIAGVLAMRVPQHQDVQRRALGLSESGLWAGRSANSAAKLLQPARLASSLRTLGGLLFAGHWNPDELQVLRTGSRVGSAERELYDILLGWRYSPQLTRLEHELSLEREERRRESVAHAQAQLVLKTQIVDLEQDLNHLQQEHREQGLFHEEQSKELREEGARLSREKQELHSKLRQIEQEKQALATSAKQALQERERLQAEAKKWQEYSQQLEREVTLLRRPKS